MRSTHFLILLLVLNVVFAHGQVRYGDGPLPKYFAEADFRAGEYSQNITSSSLTSGYNNPLNPYAGNLNFTGTKSFSYRLQFGYLFGQKRRLGIGAGIFYMRQTGNLELDSLHVEFQGTDYQGKVFRQMISSNGQINETVKTSNVSIPLFLRYKKDIMPEDMFVTIDAGILLNLMLQNKYNSNAGFDYEAIYKISGTGSDLTYSYDNGKIPAGTDWLITKSEFLKDNPKGDMQAYFNSLKAVGYNVGLGDSVKKSGKINYSNKSIGFMFQSALNYKITDRIYGKAGIYVFEQSFTNPSNKSSTTLTNGSGDYNSLLNFTQNVQTWSYGLLFGINFYM